MDDRNTKLAKMLIALAWADGRIESDELEVVEAVLDGFGAENRDKTALVEWAKTPRTLDDIDLAGLSKDDLELGLSQAVLLTFVDGQQSEKERQILDALVSRSGLSAERAAQVIEQATAHAQSLLPLLDEPHPLGPPLQ